MTDINNYVSFKSGSDWSPAIIKAISDLSAVGGGTLYFPKGTFNMSGGINMVNNVRLKGAGIGQTKLTLMSGSNRDMFIFKGVSYTGVSDMTLDGAKWNGANTVGSCIVIDGRKFGISDPGAVVHGLIIERLWITGFAENGVASYYPVWQYTMRHLDIEFCDGHGMYIDTTDNSYESIIIGNCKGSGIYDSGANNRYVSIKSIFNGRGATDYLNTAGVYLENASRHTLINVEAQENYGHGFIVKNSKNINLNGIITDANGYNSMRNGTPVAGDGFQIIGSNSISVRSFQAVNFKPTKTQDRTLYIDSTSSDVFFDYQTDNNSARDVEILSDFNINIQRNNDVVMNRFKYGNETLNNLIQNGQWSGGSVTNWKFISNPMYSISNGVLTFTGKASNTRVGQNVTLTNGRKYFISAKVQTTSTSLSFKVLKDSSPWPTFGSVSARGTNIWETLSSIFTLNNTTGTYEIHVADSRTSAWNAVSIKEFMIIDVTDVFKNTSLPANSAKAFVDVLDANDGWFQGIKTFGLSGKVASLVGDLNAVKASVPGSSSTSKWSGKNVLAIGDSLTEGGSKWQPTVSSIHGCSFTNHALGGASFQQMVNGGTTTGGTIGALTVGQVTGKDLIIVFGGMNERNRAYGQLGDLYPTQDTIHGRVQFVINKLYELLAQASNLGCKILFIAPYCCGVYSNINVDGYGEYPVGSGQTLEKMVNHIKTCVNYNNLPVVDLWHESGIGKHTWSLYQFSVNDQVHLNSAGYTRVGEVIASRMNLI